MEQFEEKVVADEATIVTKRGRKPKETVEVESEEVELKAEAKTNEISAKDLIDTLYTYAPSPVKKGNFKQNGKCLICGVPTAAVERKICWECLQKHRDELTVV